MFWYTDLLFLKQKERGLQLIGYNTRTRNVKMSVLY